MTKQSGRQREEKPWFGKTCARCESPINYAYAAKGPIPGYCGKCADELRVQLQADFRREMRGDRPPIEPPPPVDRPRTGGSLMFSFLTGAVFGTVVLLVIAAFAPGRVEPILQAIRSFVRGGP